MQTTESEIQFAICVAGEEGDLAAWKVYRLVPDSKADEVACLRVMDESSEDYLRSCTTLSKGCQRSQNLKEGA